MSAGRQFNGGSPGAALAGSETDGLVLPVCEISHQLHAGCSGRGEGELLMRAMVSFFHINVLIYALVFVVWFQGKPSKQRHCCAPHRES